MGSFSWSTRAVSTAAIMWAVANGLAIWRIAPDGPARATVVESVTYLLVAWVVALHAPTRTTVSRLTFSQRILGALAFTLLLSGQLVKHDFRTFPFPSWTMYSEDPPESRVWTVEFEGLTTSGREVRLEPSRVITPLRRYRLKFLLRREFAVAHFGEPGTRERAHRRFVEAVEALAHGYEASHPDDPLSEVRVYFRETPHGPHRPLEPRRAAGTLRLRSEDER